MSRPERQPEIVDANNACTSESESEEVGLVGVEEVQRAAYNKLRSRLLRVRWRRKMGLSSENIIGMLLINLYIFE